jgi:hypothetical protein
MIGHGKIELHYLPERAHKAYGLPQWQTQRRTVDQRCFSIARLENRP